MGDESKVDACPQDFIEGEVDEMTKSEPHVLPSTWGAAVPANFGHLVLRNFQKRSGRPSSWGVFLLAPRQRVSDGQRERSGDGNWLSLFFYSGSLPNTRASRYKFGAQLMGKSSSSEGCSRFKSLDFFLRWWFWGFWAQNQGWFYSLPEKCRRLSLGFGDIWL